MYTALPGNARIENRDFCIETGLAMHGFAVLVEFDTMSGTCGEGFAESPGLVVSRDDFDLVETRVGKLKRK